MKQGLFILTTSDLWKNTIKNLSSYKIYPKIIIGEKKKLKNFKNTLIYDNFSARLAIPPSFLKKSEIVSNDESLFFKMSSSISMANEMLTRFLPHKSHISTRERYIFINNLIDIYYSIYEKYRIDFVISTSTPHRVFDYIACEVAKLKNIKVFQTRESILMHYHYFSNNPSIVFPNHNSSKSKSTKISPLISNEISKIRNLEKRNYSLSVDSPYTQLKMKKKKFSDNAKKQKNMMINLKGIVSGNKPYYVGNLPFNLFKIYTKYKVYKAKNFYKKNSIKLPTKKNFLYFPCSYQPEAGSIPGSGCFSNTVLTASYLNEIIPNNFKILFKIHPKQFSNPVRRDNAFDISYLKYIKSVNPNIEFLDLNTDVYEIIKNSEAVILDVKTSSTFFEAMSLGKKIINLSHEAYFRNFRNVLDCSRFFINKYKVKNFIKKKFNNKFFLEDLSAFEKLTTDLSHYYTSNAKVRYRNIEIKKNLNFEKKFLKIVANTIISN